jgi:hypothetical protein
MKANHYHESFPSDSVMSQFNPIHIQFPICEILGSLDGKVVCSRKFVTMVELYT